jgi:hypothetical protein
MSPNGVLTQLFFNFLRICIMSEIAIKNAAVIFQAAHPVIKIKGIGGKRWKRNVAKGSRIGPWLQADYDILNQGVWDNKEACLYMVAGNDEKIRYVGISRNGLKHRWRTSPALDEITMQKLPNNQLFHSQCWKHIEQETATNSAATFEVRSISAKLLVEVLENLDSPISAFAALRDDDESVVASVERWLCNYQSQDLARWNIAMTGKKSAK